MAADVDVPFPTREFRLFLRELDRVERQLRILLRGDLDAVDPGLPRDAEGLRARLVTQLAGGAARARRERYDPASPDFTQAQYLMARTGDTALARLDWPARTGLRPLTEEFPRPPLIAEDLQQQIEDLLDADPPSPDLCELYLLALTAGLQPESGGIEAPDGTESWGTLRRVLYERIAGHRPELLAPAGDELFPDAYRLSQPYGRTRFIPDLRPWLAALLLVLTGLVLAAGWTYRRATREMPPVLDTPPRCESGCP
jgi:hypothetical protein